MDTFITLQQRYSAARPQWRSKKRSAAHCARWPYNVPCFGILGNDKATLHNADVSYTY